MWVTPTPGARSWTGLQGVVWRTVSGFGLSAEDRKDVFAAAFFRLFERLDTVREPDKLPGWIATTTRNEALTLVRARQRLEPRDTLATMTPTPPPSTRGCWTPSWRRRCAGR